MNPELPENQDPAWDLLGKARATPVEPQFVRRVMAAVHDEQEAKAARWAWLWALFAPAARPVWLAAAAALVVAGFWFARQPAAPREVAGVSEHLDDSIIETVSAELAMLDEVDDIVSKDDAQALSDADLERVLF